MEWKIFFNRKLSLLKLCLKAGLSNGFVARERVSKPQVLYYFLFIVLVFHFQSYDDLKFFHIVLCVGTLMLEMLVLRQRAWRTPTRNENPLSSLSSLSSPIKVKRLETGCHFVHLLQWATNPLTRTLLRTMPNIQSAIKSPTWITLSNRIKCWLKFKLKVHLYIKSRFSLDSYIEWLFKKWIILKKFL